MQPIRDQRLQDRHLTEHDHKPLRRLVMGVCCLALVLLVYPLIRAFVTVELNFNEGWNAYHQSRAVAGQLIYGTLSPVAFCNYPPLSFYIVGWLGRIIGDPVLAGRLCSLAAIAAIATSVGLIVRRSGGDRLSSFAGAAICGIVFCTLYIDYAGVNDPQLLGMAFSLAALVVAFGDRESIARGIGIAALVSLSLLIKHNLVIVPVVIFARMALHRQHRQLCAYVAAGAVFGIVATAVLWWREGPQFFDQLLLARRWWLDRAVTMSLHTLSRLGPLILIGFAGLLASRSRDALAILLYAMLSLALGIYFMGGSGTGENMFFDLAIALSIAAGMTIALLRSPAAPRWAAPIALGAAILVPLAKLPVLVLTAHAGLAGGHATDAAAFHDEVAILKAHPGPAFCESQLLCYRAGKAMAVDPFNAIEAVSTGDLPADALTGRLARKAYSVVQINSFARNFHSASPTARAFVSAIHANYHLAHEGLSGQIWLPNSSEPTR